MRMLKEKKSFCSRAMEFKCSFMIHIFWWKCIWTFVSFKEWNPFSTHWNQVSILSRDACTIFIVFVLCFPSWLLMDVRALSSIKLSLDPFLFWRKYTEQFLMQYWIGINSCSGSNKHTHEFDMYFKNRNMSKKLNLCKVLSCSDLLSHYLFCLLGIREIGMTIE